MLLDGFVQTAEVMKLKVFILLLNFLEIASIYRLSTLLFVERISIFLYIFVATKYYV